VSKPIVLLFEAFHRDGLALLQEKCEVRYASNLEEGHLLTEVADVNGIIVRANGEVSRRLMAAAPHLKVVGRHGVGVDNIDLAAAAERGIVVVNTPGVMTESVAEHCLGLMLALTKWIVRADKAARQGAWQVRYEYIGEELYGKTLGVVGFGQIGQRVAELCHQALKMPVLYWDVVEYPEAAAGVKAHRVPLEELLSQADVVSLHVPLLPDTQGLIGEAELRRMKPGAYLINTARGPIVEQAALVTALQEGWIAGAGLDVFAEEPAHSDNPLFALDNVIVTPHMASHTQEATRRMAMTVVSDVIAVLEGRQPGYPVNL
jgi:D-3-phosphoglycerate dehydrogenase